MGLALRCRVGIAGVLSSSGAAKSDSALGAAAGAWRHVHGAVSVRDCGEPDD
jgi:hypothetical protein